MAEKLCQLKKKGSGGESDIDLSKLEYVNGITVANYSSPTISYNAAKIGNILIISGSSFSSIGISNFTFTGITVLLSKVIFQTTINKSDMSRGAFCIIAKVTNTNVSVKINEPDGYLTWGILEYQ